MTERLRAIVLLVRTAWRVDPLRSLGLLLEPVAFLRTPLFAWCLKLMVDGAIHHDGATLTESATCATFAAVLGFAGLWFGSQFRIRLIEAVGFELNREIAILVSNVPGLEAHERADFQDQLELLRQGHGLLGTSLNTILSALKVTAFGVGTLAVLAYTSPTLLFIVPFALPALGISTLQQRWLKAAEAHSAEPSRRSRYLQGLTTDRSAIPELHVFGLGREIISRFERDWLDASHVITSVHTRCALFRIAGDLFFYCGFAGGMAVMFWRAQHGYATVGDLMLAIFLMQEVKTAVVDPIRSATNVGETIRVAGRILWLKDYAEAAIASTTGTQPAPARITDGITFDDVSFRYPGTEQWVLRNISFHLPAGATAFLIGENGAGKTTLVKLLCRMYEPTSGRILVDGVDLCKLEIGAWRSRLSAAFQDFARFEFIAQQTVGLGDLSNLEDRQMVHEAMRKAGAPDMLPALPEGSETQLGVRWSGGVELSGGQWQKLALGRALIRDNTLLVFFDEPTANLDALTEHTLFERYAQQGQAGSVRGAITILVSHRFSSAQSADLVIVMDGGVVAEVGSHHQLLKESGLYAELYRLQARQYA